MSKVKLKSLIKIFLTIPVIYIWFFSITFGSNCNESINVCGWLENVFIVKTNNTTASAVKLSEDFFVTNKHVVEDNLNVNLYNSEGVRFNAKVLHNDHPADIVILSKNHEKEFKVNPIKISKNYNGLRSVAFGIGRDKIRIFPPGDLISVPLERFKQARIHSTVRNLPGISGGALINEKGNLVGILTSGSGNYNEAIPINILNEVIKSTSMNLNGNISRYTSIKKCAQLIEIMHINPKMLSKNELFNAEKDCKSANLKSFFDMLGQIFGNLGNIQKSLLFLEISSDLDPNSPTSLISLAIAYQFNRDFKNQVKVLKKLIKLIPNDVLVLRMAIQSAAFSNDINFARQSLNLINKNNKRSYKQAYEFLKQTFPRI
jgi:hypothetical protein